MSVGEHGAYISPVFLVNLEEKANEIFEHSHLSLHSSRTRNCGRGRVVFSNLSAINVGTPGLRGGPKIWVAVSNALQSQK